MNSKKGLSPAKYIFLALAGLAGAALILAAVSKYGPGITHDSAAYMYASESLLKTGRLDYFGYPSPFIQWPPLYPVLLAAGGLFGLAPAAVSGYINALAFGMIVFFSGHWMFARLKSVPAAVSGTLLILASLPLIVVTRFVWTETLFILFILLFYIMFEKYLTGGRLIDLVLAGVFTALACLDRYAGVTVALAASLLLLFEKKVFLERVRDIFIYGITASIPLGAWVARNYILSSTLLGVRIPSTYTLRQNIKRSWDSVLTWIQPDGRLISHFGPLAANTGKLMLPIFSAAAVLLFIAAAAASAAVKKGRERYNETVASELLPIKFFAAFSAIYLVYLVASATSVAFEPINFRYLSPVYLPAALIVIVSADFVLYRLKGCFKTGAVVNVVFCLAMAAVLAYPAANTAASVLGSIKNGAGGVSSDLWHNNKLVLYLKENRLDGTYYSNKSDSVYSLTGVRTFSLPKKSGPYMYGLEQFINAVEKDENSYLIWFKNGVPDTLYGLEDIGGMFRLELVESNSDGKVFRILNKDDGGK